VPYDAANLRTVDLIRYYAARTCPHACALNYVFDGEKCIACATWAKALGCTAVPPLQPRPCDFRYAHWNASNGRIWWQPEFTPPFLKSIVSATTMRAGLCWACMDGEGVSEGDADLCVLQPGFARTAEISSLLTQVSIPVLPQELAVVFQEPRPTRRNVAEAPTRRLLTLSGRAPDATQEAAALPLPTNVPCPVGYYKNERGEGPCYACPYGTSTAYNTTTHQTQCICRMGWFRPRRDSFTCEPCAVDTHRPYGASELDACVRCSALETTFGLRNATACACKPGYMRGAPGVCVPCPPNTYCRPCFMHENCNVLQTACFPDGVAPAGSTHVDNCSCSSGQVPLRRPTGQLYCATVPPTAVYDARLKRVSCRAGWTAAYDAITGQLVSCRLCGAGAFAVQQTPTVVCRPCPRGTYTSMPDAEGNCTACPYAQTTLQEGATTLASCGCTPPMVPRADGTCAGCLGTQYSSDGRACVDCPTHAVSDASGTRVEDCKCSPGFFLEAAVCVPCAVGFYSARASNHPCSECPRGSTTAERGSTSIRACGATAALCLPGYALREGMGCVVVSLLV
jgi:hypothetical protein